MTFKEAMMYLKEGHYIKRESWGNHALYYSRVEGELSLTICSLEDDDRPHCGFSIQEKDEAAIDWIGVENSEADIHRFMYDTRDPKTFVCIGVLKNGR